MLSSHDWPGNIRELANAIKTPRSSPAGARSAPSTCRPRSRAQRPRRGSAPRLRPIAGPHFQVPDGSPTLRDVEMKYIQMILEKHNGNKPAASKELGISLKTLYNKINQLQQN